eukprot:CAMPEP_0184699284 /NCGR_PEP_ID=MMETSP0313-20130426/5612_1 /TAXON_ID=2792 /ORGANISM="Porphyridium aerugineum, Strain SAG 1380-2" /LENGTH=176 /DNA_ID=CAMNT_0027158353 /DNA_START=153 /DNA_END=683 /DNA_ORIENTATION=-
MTSWTVIEKFAEIWSQWLTIIGEKVEDDRGKILEYWRVEKVDSVIVIAIQNEHFVLPEPMYRHGIGEITLDFVGGRVPEHATPLQTAPNLIIKELGIEPNQIQSVALLHDVGYPINSSFSNQRMYTAVATLESDAKIASKTRSYSVDHQGVQRLLNDIICLQCRAALMEWQYGHAE